MRLILLGAPGAGKGTVAKLLTQIDGSVQISTGDILRGAVQAGTELGKQADAYMKAGDLVPDDLIMGIMETRLQEPDCAKGFILDGFPRTVAQAEALTKLLADEKMKLDAVVELKVDEKALMARIENRARETVAAGGTVRADDNPESFKIRLDAYREQTAPVSAYYAGIGELKTVDGMAPIDEVTKAINGALAG